MASSVPLRTEPVELDGIAANLMAAGAVLGGKRVVRIVFELEDGGVLERRFGTPDPKEASGPEEMTEQEEGILEVLGENPYPMTRKDVAMRLGLAAPTGYFGKTLSRLIRQEKIFAKGAYITDVAEKFTDTS
jgi:hypothetical protein